MALVHTLTIALHVLFAASWFGLALALPALARAQASGGAPGGGRVLTMMNGAVVLFYVFAVANWTLGMQLGFRAQYNAWPYHTSISLGLALVVVQFLLIRTGWNRLTNGTDAAEVAAGRKRLGMGIGIGHAVWLGIFVLMYVGRGVIAG